MVDLADVRIAGLDKYAVRRRVAAGRLHPLFVNTWAVGHRAVTMEGWFLAAVKSVGGDAAITGPSLLQLRGLHERKVGEIHVATSRRPGRRPRIRIHSMQEVPRARDVKGIPVTTLTEAFILAAASDMTDKALRHALRQAYVKNLLTPAMLREARDRRGVARLRALSGAIHPRSKSELEDAAIALLRRYGYEPEINVEIDGVEWDLLVGDVFVELDSKAFHDNPISAADDALRHAAGRKIQRWTWDDVTTRPVRTMRRLGAAIA
jgi:hypothetical protein